MPVNSRNVGHQYEREVCKKYREELRITAETSRYASKKLDDMKVDIVLPIDINPQCKRYTKSPNLMKVLSEMPDDDNINVVHWKWPRKGEIVAMSSDDYFKLLKKAYPSD